MNVPCCIWHLEPRLASYDYLVRLYLNHIYLSTHKNVHIEREVFKLPVPEELGEAPEYAPKKSGGKGKGRGRGGKSNHRGGKGGGKGKTSHRNGKGRRGGKERKGAEPSTGKE